MSDRGRYPRIIAVCWRAAVSTELEYRFNVVIGMGLSVFWMAWAAVGAGVYFQFAGSLAGWTYPELLVVIGLFFSVNGLRQAVFQPNLERISGYVRQGTLDFLLTKPVDAQVLVSLRHLNVGALADPALGLVLAALGVAATGRGVTVGDAASFVLLFGVAGLLLYALMLVLMALSVVFVGADELDTVAFGAVELARMPVQLYRNPVQTILTVIPVALLTTVPAQALLGRLDPRLLAVGPAVAAASLAAATLAWRRALRGYTGASA